MVMDCAMQPVSGILLGWIGIAAPMIFMLFSMDGMTWIKCSLICIPKNKE